MIDMLPFLQIAAMAMMAGAVVLISWRILVLSRQLRAIEPKLQGISDEIAHLHQRFAQGLEAQEGAIAETVRKMQAEVKSLELQMRDSGLTTRENPEAVEVAIRLVHEGYEADQIVSRTGLPAEVVESIILFHGAR
jgi:glutamine cyclotransferase